MQTKSLTTTDVADGQEEILVVSGNTITVKLDGEQTDDAYSVFEVSAPPNIFPQ